MSSQILYQHEAVRIEYVQAKPRSFFDNPLRFIGLRRKARFLAYTFTNYGFRDFEAPGFGQRFLLRSGFDVISFKCVDDSWFQGIPNAEIERFLELFPRSNYESTVAYGSSMGGYAAIALAGMLQPDKIIAIAPQYAIDEPFDTRWASDAPRIKWTHRIPPRVTPRGKIFIVRDPGYQQDSEQIDRLVSNLRGVKIEMIDVPFSGHHPGEYLNEIGELKALVTAVAEGAPISADLRRNRRQSKRFYLTMAGALNRKRKFRSALRMLDQALLIDPDLASAFHQKALILTNLGDLKQADEMSLKAVDLKSDIADHHHQRSAILARLGRVEEAIECSRQSISRKPSPKYYQHLSALLGRQGMYKQAIAELQTALDIKGHDPVYERQMERLRRGARNAAETEDTAQR